MLRNGAIATRNLLTEI